MHRQGICVGADLNICHIMEAGMATAGHRCSHPGQDDPEDLYGLQPTTAMPFHLQVSSAQADSIDRICASLIILHRVHNACLAEPAIACRSTSHTGWAVNMPGVTSNAGALGALDSPETGWPAGEGFIHDPPWPWRARACDPEVLRPPITHPRMRRETRQAVVFCDVWLSGPSQTGGG